MTRRPRSEVRISVAALALVLQTVLAAPVSAATSAGDKALAEALFDEGLKLMREGQFEKACPKLEQSGRIDPGIGTLLYLAECYEKTGRTASAWATFREAMSEAQATGQADRARKAQDRASALEASLSRLTIEASPESREIPDLTVKRAGKVLEPSLWGVPLPIDPGKYNIEVSAPGYDGWSTSVTIPAQASTQTVKIPALKKLAETAPAAPDAPPAPADAEPTSAPAKVSLDSESQSGGLGLQQTLGVIVGGVGIVGLGVGSYFGFEAISKNGDAEQLCPRGNVCDHPDGVARTEEAKDAALISNIAIGAGAVLVASGMVLYFTGSPKKAQSGLQILPEVGHTSVALRVGGVFR